MIRLISQFPRVVIFSLLLSSILLARGIWSHYVQQKHNDLVEQFRRRDWPIELKNIGPPDRLEDEDARRRFENALDDMFKKHNHESPTHQDIPLGPFTSDKWKELAAASEGEFQKLIADMHFVAQHRLCTAPNYWLKHGQNGIFINEILCDSALHHLVQKNPDVALTRIQDALAISHLFAPDYATSTYHYSLAARMLAYQRLNIIVSKLSDHELIAQRSQIQSLMETLVNESSQFDVRGKSIPYIFAEADEVFENKLNIKTWMIDPFLQTVMNREAETSLQLNQVLAQPNCPKKNFGLQRFSGCIMNAGSSPIESYAIYYVYCVRVAFFHKSYSHAAGVHMACRLYRIDNGRFPDKLDDLVPKYLTQIPLDSSNPIPTPIGFKVFNDPEFGKRPVLIFNSGAPNDPGPMPYCLNPQPNSLKNINARQYIDLTWSPAMERM